jgi:hypothetical protein
MSSLTEIRAMGSILDRKSRGRIWNNDIPVQLKKKKSKKKLHIKKNWNKDLWD